MKELVTESKLAILGGNKSINKTFNKHVSIGKEEIQAVNDVMVDGVLSKFIGAWDPDFFGGPKVLAFESACSEYFQVNHAITVNSWTSGLIVAIGAIGIEPGDEVIVSPWTMSASAMAILHWNAIPVFADIEQDTFCLDIQSIESKITPRTKAIMAIDIFGNSAAMNEIMELARRNNLKVISDSAQSPGAVYAGKKAGTTADIGGISLNYHKHIHTGEGGVLFTDDDELATRMKLIRNHAESVVHGMGIEDLTNMVGYNFRLGEIEAAIGIEQLKKLNSIILQKQYIANALTSRLKNLPGLITPTSHEDLTNVYYVYPLIIDTRIIKISRSRLVQALREEGVPALAEGYQNIHLLPIFQKKIAFGKKGFPWSLLKAEEQPNYKPGSCPVAEKLHSQTYISLGLTGLDLTKGDAEMIADAFQKVWNNLENLAI
jgi:perosamine synthetase